MILLKQPDAVFLQEVISSSLALLQQKLKTKYSFFAPTCPPEHYFVVILVKKGSNFSPGVLDSTTYPGTNMGRQLLQLPLSFKGINLVLMTSHLESLKDYSTERKTQLRTAFEMMAKKAREGKSVAIFGGDLNVREDEVRSVKVPEGIVDAWQECGSDRATQFTWDVKNNDNLRWMFPNRPQARFDRVYCSTNSKLRPAKFELVGQDRLHSCGRFPSDHWGLWVEFSA